MRKKYTVISLSLILMMLLIIAPTAYAASPADEQAIHVTNSSSSGNRSAAPNNRPLSSLEELLEWHTAPWVRGGCPVLAEDIIVNRPITLAETAGQKQLGAIDHIIRVTAGGSLTLNNSKLIIQGIKPQAVIVVEAGGQLLLQNGAIYTAPGDAIVVEKGGRLVKSAAFLIDGGSILDKNDENELPAVPNPDPNPPPNEPEENPDPLLQPTLPALQNTVGFDYSLSCLLGEPPVPSDYPSTEWVTYEIVANVPMQKELPVQWELDCVDFQTAGTYAVKGIFSAEVLAANGLSNPNHISSTLQLTVIKPSPIDALTGNVLSVGSEGNCHIRLAMPPLPEGATALYIYKSADGQSWQKAVQEVYTNGHIPSSYDNFLPHAMITPTNLYVQYYYQTDYRPIWLRVEIIGSAASGISNEMKLDMPASAKPGDSTNTGETGDDDGSGGNRGGGGQSEGDRELPNVPEKPAPEESMLPTDKTPEVSSKIPSVSAPEQTSGGTTTPTAPTSGETAVEQTPKGEAPQSATVPGETSGGTPPVSPPSDSKQEEQGETLAKQEGLLADMEIDPEGTTEVQALSAGAESSPPLQKSRGVFLTAGATAFVAGSLLLFRKRYKIRKRKP